MKHYTLKKFHLHIVSLTLHYASTSWNQILHWIIFYDSLWLEEDIWQLSLHFWSSKDPTYVIDRQVNRRRGCWKKSKVSHSNLLAAHIFGQICQANLFNWSQRFWQEKPMGRSSHINKRSHETNKNREQTHYPHIQKDFHRMNQIGYSRM